MESNITLRSNIYVNKTAKRTDAGFVQHLLDYSALSKYYDPVSRKSEIPLTAVQREVLKRGLPKCAFEAGTKSWGVPIGSDRFVCRCEEQQCPRYSICSALDNFELVIREADERVASSLPIVPSEHCTAPQTNSVPAPPMEKSLTPSAPREPRPVLQEECIPAVRIEKPVRSATPSKPRPATQMEYTQAERREKATISPATPERRPNPAAEHKQMPRPFEPTMLCDEETAVPPPTASETVPGSLASQDAVISADTDSRICVTAGPGTGKTYIVIKRLQKLLAHDHPSKAILVLCFSKNAVYIIRERLRAELGDRVDALIADERLVIRTFDSFATYMLADELPKGLGYDQRIELFTKKLADHPGLLDDVEYLIVDEMQDTVGARARMLKAIIEQSGFGVLLLGDRCQAIYDWSVRGADGWTSSELFDWIGSQGFQIIELEKNYRQETELGGLGDFMRQSLLNGGEEEQEQALELCKVKIEARWPGYTLDNLPRKLLRENELILCKTNGEAAAVSDLLYGGSQFIEHTVQQNANHKTLAPWIGMLLGGCTKPIMDRDAFLARAEAYGMADAGEKWAALLSLDSHTRSKVLHRQDVLSRLTVTDDLPGICLNRAGEGVIVSTVHRAKGSEAEHAYWMDSPLVFDKQAGEDGAKSDALKAAYVAITRAKKDIRLIESKNLYIRSLGDGHWIKTGLGKNMRPYCAGITLQPEDVDLASCAAGTEAEQKQEIIRSLEPGLDVSLYPAPDGTFEVFFDGMPIGKTTAQFTAALFEGFQMTNKNRNMPVSLDSVYISSLVTVVCPGGGSGYQASGCWLGYELGGFALINYT